MSKRDANGQSVVNWQRSSGTLAVAGLAVTGEDLPRLAAGRGTLEFARGSTQVCSSTAVSSISSPITSARVDWPRKGAPRLHATLQGELSRRCCAARCRRRAWSSSPAGSPSKPMHAAKKNCASRTCGE